MNIEFTRLAREDLASIVEYVSARNPAAAARLAARIRKSIGRLERLPFSAPRRRSDDTRMLVISGTRYFAIYRVVEHTVEILRIYHSARNIAR